MRKLFEAVDVDGSGQVDAEEFGRWLRMMDNNQKDLLKGRQGAFARCVLNSPTYSLGVTILPFERSGYVATPGLSKTP